MGHVATAINCISGRVQIPVISYIIHTYGVAYVDMITAPGVNKLLAEGLYLTTTELIKKSAEISVNGHGSRLIDLPPFIGPLASRVLGSLWRVKTARVWRTLPV